MAGSGARGIERPGERLPRTGFRLRRRAAGLVGGAALLFLVGTNVQSGWVFVLSSLLLGVLGAGVVLPVRMSRGVEVARRAPDEAFAGDEIRVDLVIANRGRRPAVSLSVRDRFVAPARVFVPWLRPGASATAATIRAAARRGVVDGGPVEVASSAPFGLAEVRRAVRAPGRIVIYPGLVPVGDLSLLGASWAEGESARSVSRGAGREFHGVREYQRGDSLRHVHWPSTARHGSLIVREFEPDRPARLAVVVDTWADGGWGEGDSETVLDACCSVGASVAVEALRRDHGVTLSAGRNGSVATLPDPDRAATLTWFAELVAPGGVALSEVLRRVPPGSATILVVLPAWRSNALGELAPEIERLAGSGRAVAAVVVDPGQSGPSAPGPGRAEVDGLVAGLDTAGAAVRLVRPGDDLGAAMGGRPAGVTR